MFPLSAKAKRNIHRILPHGIIWLFLGIIFFLVEIGVSEGIPASTGTRIALTPKVLVFALLAITLVGFMIGAIELFYLNHLLAKKSFFKKILYKFLFYSVLFLVITTITYPIAVTFELHTSLTDERVWRKFLQYLQSWNNVSSLLQLGTALLVSLFYTEFSENIGHGILVNFLTGKYHHPVQEERIFLFLDMNSSTAIAEQLGHEKYFELLKSFYHDLSPAIIEHAGEVYQYVGDEVVVTWPIKNGLENENCLNCFFEMQKDLSRNAQKYEKAYGIVPSFKGGIHSGTVTTGEIGVLKKEIIFTGDVLNTTARIQSLCHQYDEVLIISEDLKKQFPESAAFKFKPLGTIELRGKQQAVDLYAPHRKTFIL